MIRASRSAKQNIYKSGWRLTHRHRMQIVAQSQADDLSGTLVITFSPADRSHSFHGKTLARLGSSVLVALRYEASVDGQTGHQMPFIGVRGRARADGSVRYGDQGDVLFQYDAALPPRPRATGAVIDCHRNCALVERLLQMDRACKKVVRDGFRLRDVPTLPRIWLGFAPSEPHPFEDTPALRNRAADILGIPKHRLGMHGVSILDPFLQDVWEQELVWPGTPSNPTEHLLADAEFCTNARSSLAIYEDLSDLVGVYVWNKVRATRLTKAPNPARDVLRHFNVDPSQNFNQPLSDELLQQLETAMRDRIGGRQRHFTQEEIFDGLTSPDQPLVAFSAALPRLRANLSPYCAACCTDEDLLKAARNPQDPLYASGACKVQVLAASNPASLKMSSDVLDRRIELDLNNESRRPSSACGSGEDSKMEAT